MEQDIRDLLHICVPTLGSAIEAEVDKPITNFRGDSYPRLATLDKQIPGVGMHFVIWSVERHFSRSTRNSMALFAR